MDTKEKEFTSMVCQYKGTVYTVCYMFSSDPDEVSDLFQDVLVNLWKGFDGFRGESKPETWIWRVALNTCISADRKKRREGDRIPLDTNIDLFSDDDADTQQIRMLYSRIHRLGPVDRALVLLWLENLSYDEIGAIVGISAGNVGVKLHRIRQQLTQMSDEEKA